MKVKLTVTAGPHVGREFEFDGHDTFLVGRSKAAHFRLSHDDPYFSRRHFLIEANPPRVRVIDLNSRNGTRVNGAKVPSAELQDGDQVRAGHTVFTVSVVLANPEHTATFDGPVAQLFDSSPSFSGVEVPGYRLGAELGRGGMGVVLRAVRLADGTAAAVKLVSTAAGVGRRQVDKFLREARIMGELRHPNIVARIDAGETSGGQLFIAMELVDGPDLSKVLKDRGPLAVPTAVRAVCQALDGLAHAHDRGFVHRDVKPSNLLAAGPPDNPVVKVADFGLARAYEESNLSGLTMQGEAGGTPAFMAPEQVTHYRDVKPPADQYAAAATLYTLVSNKLPYDPAPTVPHMLARILSQDPVPLLHRRPDLPPGLAAAVHTAMAREPAQRFRDARAFRQALLPFA